MENTPYLYDTLIASAEPTCQLARRSPSQNPGLDAGGPDQLPLDQPGAWSPFVVSRAQYSQSTVRRFRRWLDNDKIDRAHTLWSAHAAGHGGLVWQAALCGPAIPRCCGDTYCIVRLSVIYRGRAVPLMWSVLEHGSAAVAY